LRAPRWKLARCGWAARELATKDSHGLAQGVDRVYDHLDGVMRGNYDKFELYVLTNIFKIPDKLTVLQARGAAAALGAPDFASGRALAGAARTRCPAAQPQRERCAQRSRPAEDTSVPTTEEEAALDAELAELQRKTHAVPSSALAALSASSRSQAAH
jgi:hypothetical protein